MDSEFLLMFTYNKETIVLRLMFSSSYLDFNLKLLEKGIVLDFGSTKMYYRMSNNDHNCVLSNEEDWSNMLLLMRGYGLTVTNIYVAEGQGVVVDGGLSISPVQTGNMITGMSAPQYMCEGNTSSEAFIESQAYLQELDEQDDSSSDDEGPLLSIEWKNNKRPLLSDSWSSMIKEKGQVFKGGVSEFRVALAKFSCEIGFKFTYKRNTKHRVAAVCAKRTSHGCGWNITATISKVNGWFHIIKLDNSHTCPLVVQTNKRMGSVLMALLIIDKVRAEPTTSPTDVVEHFNDDYGMEVNYDMAWRAVERSRSMIFGNYRESFQELSWYLNAVKQKNPGSIADMEIKPETRRFHRLIISYAASISGFKHCRPMLFIDGTFLTSRFQGCLLSAIAKDGNNGLFPLAFAIVDAENKENWSWFLGQLTSITGNERELLYLSDRNLGLMEVFAREYPHLKHFYCLHHLKCNLRNRFSGHGHSNAFREKIVNQFRDCARAPTTHVFEQRLAELKSMGGRIVQEFLMELPYEKWAHAHSPNMRYGEMTSNAAESFNKWILEARSLPITHMINAIRVKMMNSFYKRRTEADTWTAVLCGDKQKKWDAAVKEARQWNATRSSTSIIEFHCNPPAYVDIKAKFCSCYDWQFHGFPCVHAIAAVSRSDIQIYDIVDPHYFTDTYKKCYEGIIVPVPPSTKKTESVDSGDIVLPPDTKRKPGRPKKVRIRSKGEKVRRIRCSRCKKLARHNRKSCKAPISG